jgi:BRCT domain type II-containing protein
VTKGGPLSKKGFVFTGGLHALSRAEAEATVKRYGGEVFEERCNYVVARGGGG